MHTPSRKQDVGRDERGGAYNERAVPLELVALTKHGAQDGDQRSEEGHHRGLTLDKTEIAFCHACRFAPVIHVSEVGLCGQARRHGHFKVAFQAEQRRHENDQFGKRHEAGPMLYIVKDESGAHIAEAGQNEGDENL